MHRDRLVDFLAALEEVAGGRAEVASLVSLGRASELVVGRHTVSSRLAMRRLGPARPFNRPVPPTTPGHLYAALQPVPVRCRTGDAEGSLPPLTVTSS